jgi:two-component system phosphate regulon response regulator PhoB
MSAMAQPTTILIVDDNVNLARGFAQVLAGAGYVVHTAYTADDGLQLAQVQCPHLVIMDFRMPFVNGVGFLYRLRAMPQHRHTPVMVVTGAVVTEEMERELRDLAAIVRIKPLGVPELLTETRTLLAQESTGAPEELRESAIAPRVQPVSSADAGGHVRSRRA